MSSTINWGITFTCCSLLIKIHSLLVVKSVVARCKICSLLVAEVACSKKITRYPLQKLLAAKNYSLLVAKFARYSLQKLLVAKNNWLLVAKFARYSLQKMLLPKNHRFLVAKFPGTYCKKPFFIKTIARWNYCLFKVKKIRWKFQFYLFPRAKKFKVIEANILRWNLLLPEHCLTQM